MRVEVRMPSLGYEMETGKIVRWLKQPGDPVERGEPIAEVETDKTTIEMEALAAGTVVELVAAPGDEVPVGDVVAILSSKEAAGDG
jgi:pyruvate/2-oxoglutarate dehydrogenase complex dihydrolipoamide acyltransferase (E2) component